MIFQPPLESAQLQKRYKRFLADVRHPKLGEITAHCPNTGSMKNCWQEGWTVWLQDSQNPKRKYQYSWILAENNQGELIGVNTQIANQLVFDGITNGKVAQLQDIKLLEKEIKYGTENSRIDLLITHSDNSLTYIEVKSVTLKDPEVPSLGNSSANLGCFPDSVSTRGQKHIRELIHCVEQGHRAVLFFMVQHSGIDSVTAATHIDPAYAELLKLAMASGVEVVAYGAKITPKAITLDRQLEFFL